MDDKESELLFIMLGIYVFNLLDYMAEIREVSS